MDVVLLVCLIGVACCVVGIVVAALRRGPRYVPQILGWAGLALAWIGVFLIGLMKLVIAGIAATWTYVAGLRMVPPTSVGFILIAIAAVAWLAAVLLRRRAPAPGVGAQPTRRERRERQQVQRPEQTGSAGANSAGAQGGSDYAEVREILKRHNVD